MSTTSTLTRGCACEAIRYKATPNRFSCFAVTIAIARRASGGPFSSFAIVPAEAFTLLQGALRFHASPSELGGMTRRGFCLDCGAPVVVRPDAVPQFVAIRTASLDDASRFNPQMDVWTADAHAWDHMNPTLPKHENYAP